MGTVSLEKTNSHFKSPLNNSHCIFYGRIKNQAEYASVILENGSPTYNIMVDKQKTAGKMKLI